MGCRACRGCLAIASVTHTRSSIAICTGIEDAVDTSTTVGTGDDGLSTDACRVTAVKTRGCVTAFTVRGRIC